MSRERPPIAAAWEAAPTAHQQILDEARRLLSTRAADKTLLVMPHPAAPPRAQTAHSRARSAGTVATLLDAEDSSRTALAAREKWERDVCAQYARMELHHHVILPMIDKVLSDERSVRSEIRMLEASAFQRLEKGETASHVRKAKQYDAKRMDRLNRETTRARVSSAPATDNAVAILGDDPATSILENYMRIHEERMRTAPIKAETRDASPLRPAPPPRKSSTGYHHHTRCLDMATAVHLQNQHVYFRRGIEDAQQDARTDMLQHFAAELAQVEDLTRRRQHLERLVYWRSARDARRENEEALRRIDGLFSDLSQQEASCRHGIAQDEGATSDYLWSMEFQSYCTAQMFDLCRMESVARGGVTADYSAATALFLVPYIESIQRILIVASYGRFVDGTAWVAHGDVTQLQTFSVRIRSDCITIQRFVRKLQLGLVGWRRTHRNIREWVQQHRAGKRHASAQGSINAYKKSIEAEAAAVFAEIESERHSQQRATMAQERLDRLEVETQDQWFRAGFHRRFRTEWIHNLILPKYALVVQEEARCRDSMDIFCQGPEMELLGKWHRLNKQLIESKWFSQKTESMDRFSLEEMESDAREVLLADGRASWQRVLNRQMHHDEEQASARSAFVSDVLVRREEDVEAEYRRDIVSLFFKFQRESVLVFASSPRLSGRMSILSAWNAGTTELCEKFLIWSHAFYGRQLKRESTQELVVFTAAKWFAMARNDEQLLFSGEQQDDRSQIEHAFNEGRMQIEERVERRHRAVLCIQRFFQDHLRGRCGRTGMRVYLRMVFAEKRARAEMRRKMAAQRDDAAHARRKLEEEISKFNAESSEAFDEILRHVEGKAEPRQRHAIESQETFLWHIMKRNFEGESVAIIKDNIGELLQRESYFRTDTFLQWKRDHEKNILPRQQVFKEDVKIRPAQRAWRCWRSHKERRARADQQVFRLPTFEQRSRTQIMMEEMEAFATGIAKPYELSEAFTQAHQLLQSDGICYGAFGFPLREILDNEWRDRISVLWSLQLTERYRLIEAQEAAERRAHTTTTLDGGRARAAVFSDERLMRGALVEERSLFLLRLVNMMEASLRAAMHQSLSVDVAALIATIVEPAHRAIVHVQWASQLLWPVQHYESNQRLRIAAAAQRDLARLCVIRDESAARVEAEDREQSAVKWYLWLAMVQESRARQIIVNARNVALEEHQTLLDEGCGRWWIWNEWRTKMDHVCSPHAAIVSRSAPYLYACEEQEADLRRRTLLQDDLVDFWTKLKREKQAVFAHYLDLSLS